MPKPPCPSTRPTEKLPPFRRVPCLRASIYPVPALASAVVASGAPQAGQVRAVAGTGLAQIGQSAVLTGPPRAATTRKFAGHPTRDVARHDMRRRIPEGGVPRRPVCNLRATCWAMDEGTGDGEWARKRAAA